MDRSHPAPAAAGPEGGGRAHPPLGPSLRRAWVGYQRQLDQAMAEAGFGERRFPDGRVLRICQRAPGTTIAQIGRELRISRQGAAAIVADLRGRGYVSVEPSATSGREKSVVLTQHAQDYLAAQGRATRHIDGRLRQALGPDGFEQLHQVLAVLGEDGDPRLRDYLRDKAGPPDPSSSSG